MADKFKCSFFAKVVKVFSINSLLGGNNSQNDREISNEFIVYNPVTFLISPNLLWDTFNEHLTLFRVKQ